VVDVTRATLSVVVPAYNEERRLPALLDRLVDDGDAVVRAAGATLLDVVIVDDGSTDATPTILAAAASRLTFVNVITFGENRGKGAAVRAGVLSANGERILVTDVDLSTPLDDLASLAAAVDGGAEVAIGSRSMEGSQVLVHQPRHRELMGKTFNLLLRMSTGIPWRDTQCGFKLFRADAAKRLFALQRVDGFAFDAELCVNARRIGIGVAEVPVRWLDNGDTRVHLIRSSARMAADLARIAWRARRPLPPEED
jgi:dolichyl-phosphate beta-glucosyltransferase